jgi:hypothetical protein
MPAAGTRLAYRTVISACPGAMPDPILFDELGKPTSGAVLLPPLALAVARLALQLLHGASEDLFSQRFRDGVFQAAHVEWHVSDE